MPSAIDSYSVTAKYYDGAYSAKQDLVDLPFYLDLAGQTAGPILDAARGAFCCPSPAGESKFTASTTPGLCLKFWKSISPVNPMTFARE
jgi:hypothetical protein